MPKCKFTEQYYNYELHRWDDFDCDDKEPLASGFCIFHDKDYLQNKNNNEEHKRKVLDRLKDKVNHAISNNEPLLCIGFQLHTFSLSDLSIIKEFPKPVYFNDSQFFGIANFDRATFQGGADFYGTKFQGRADFNKAEFNNKAYFSGAKYSSEAYFYGARFSDKSNFLKSQFNDTANFSDAMFYAEADFF